MELENLESTNRASGNHGPNGPLAANDPNVANRASGNHGPNVANRASGNYGPNGPLAANDPNVANRASGNNGPNGPLATNDPNVANRASGNYGPNSVAEGGNEDNQYYTGKTEIKQQQFEILDNFFIEEVEFQLGKRCLQFAFSFIFYAFFLFVLLSLIIVAFQISLYPAIYEFISTAGRGNVILMLIDYFGVFSDFGIFLLLIMIVFNFIDIIPFINEKLFKPLRGQEADKCTICFNVVMIFLLALLILMLYLVPSYLSVLAIFYLVIILILMEVIQIIWLLRKRIFTEKNLTREEYYSCKIISKTFLSKIIGYQYYSNIEIDNTIPYDTILKEKIELTNEIDEVKKEVKDSLEFAGNRIWEGFNKIPREELYNEHKGFIKLMFLGRYLMKNAEEQIEKNQACCKFIKMGRSCNMYGNNEFEEDNRWYNCEKCKYKTISRIYKIVVSVLVLLGQLLRMIIISAQNREHNNYVIFIRLVFLKYALDYNLYDSIINFTRTKKVIGSKNLVPLILMLVIYVVGFIGSIFAIIFIDTYELPNITNIRYEQDNHLMQRFNLTMYDTPGFCNINARVDNIYSVDDFAFMTTLPRLYKKFGYRCIINPNLRGVFNTTMKYIFGKNYTKQGIKIYCYAETHDPYLVITSDRMFEEINSSKILNRSDFETRYEYSTSSSKPYFSKDSLCSDNIAMNECNALKQCINNDGGTDPCEKEWETYTNKYWEDYKYDGQSFREFSDYEIEIPSIEEEKYLNESERFYFNPRLFSISDNTTNISGQYFLVGGGYEDLWGYTFLVEVLVRKYLPLLFSSIVPFYSIYESLIPQFFKANERYVGEIFGIIRKQQEEHDKLKYLLDKFKFDKSSIYTIGHSVSAATMKGIAEVVDVPGITFETQDTKTLGLSLNRIEGIEGSYRTNVYSDGMVLSSYDDFCEVNGRLPKLFKNPNIYDTACLTTIACSSTMKYVPLCSQVLNQHGDDPVEKFKEILIAYYKFRF